MTAQPSNIGKMTSDRKLASICAPCYNEVGNQTVWGVTVGV